MKPATVRFYIDADLLGLARVLASLRHDITYPGDPGALIHKHKRPPCRINPSDQDAEWIPVVAASGWLILTRDSNIRSHRAEINAVMDNGAKLVALASRDARDKWSQLEVVMTQWRAIERLADLPGPYVYAAHRTSLRKVA